MRRYTVSVLAALALVLMAATSVAEIVNASSKLTPTKAAAIPEHYVVPNNWTPATGQAHTNPIATCTTLDGTKAWYAAGPGANDWVPTTDLKGVALTTKGAAVYGGASGPVVMEAPANGYIREANSLASTGWEDKATDGTGLVARAAGATLIPKSTTIRASDMPASWGNIATGNYPYKVAYSPCGRYLAVIAYNDTAVEIYDMRAAAFGVAPTKIRTVATANKGRDIRWVGNTLWLVEVGHLVQLLDVTDPYNAAAMTGGTSGVLDVGADLRGLEVMGNQAVVTDVTATNDSTVNFWVVNGASRASPVVRSSLALGTNKGAWGVAVDGKYAWLALQSFVVSGGIPGALMAVDISNLDAPALIATGANGIVASQATPYTVRARDGILFVGCYGTGGPAGLRIVDGRNAPTPVQIGIVNSPYANVSSLDLLGNILFAPSAGASKLMLFDIAVLTSPAYLGSVDVSTNPTGVAVGGGLVAVVNSSNNSFSLYSVGNLLAADYARIGRLSVDRLDISKRLAVRGDVDIAGTLIADKVATKDPPVFQTGVSHTVDELIAALQAAGVFKQ